jgi:nicotinamidase/pyrazinamidase
MEMDRQTTGVIVVDVQGDFTQAEQGSLAVQGTDQAYIDAVIGAAEQFKSHGIPIFATQDFHPPDHVSFFTNHEDRAVYDIMEIDGRTQVLWPPHCVQGTRNADLLMDRDLFSAVIPKGLDPKYDSYSGFFDDNGAKTGLNEKLVSQGITTLVVFGLALDYCVRATAMDALQLGFKVILVKDLCRGVAPDTTRAALKEMASAGIRVINTISDI